MFLCQSYIINLYWFDFICLLIDCSFTEMFWQNSGVYWGEKMLHKCIYAFKQTLEQFAALYRQIWVHENEQQNKIFKWSFDWQHSLYIIHTQGVIKTYFCAHRCLIFLMVLYGAHMCLLIIDSFSIYFWHRPLPNPCPAEHSELKSILLNDSLLPEQHTHTITHTFRPPPQSLVS